MVSLNINEITHEPTTALLNELMSMFILTDRNNLILIILSDFFFGLINDITQQHLIKVHLHVYEIHFNAMNWKLASERITARKHTS